MIKTDAHVRKLMEEMSRHGEVGLAALRADMDRKTARRYLKAGKLPSQMRRERHWRTRADPFAEDWPEVERIVSEAPELEAKVLFADLMARHPDRYHRGQLRTFQRRLRRWRALSGPPKEVFFAQEHRPGEALQTDFTHAGDLMVTIAGERFDHLICHSVLPFSNWQHPTVCHSESWPALRRGLQEALFHLGRVPRFSQTDSSTAATHRLAPSRDDAPPEESAERSAQHAGCSRGRGFNRNYLDLLAHFGMQPRTIALGRSNQNGDVESLGGVLKRRLNQHLLLRGSRDFESVVAYERWVQEVQGKANALCQPRLAEELEAMRPLSVRRLSEFVEETPRVSCWSTIRVGHHSYSVPSRLIGERVAVRLYEDRIEVHYGGRAQLCAERLLGARAHRIDYRHVISWLVRKPGAFERYRYREEMFPCVVFRRAYDELQEALGPRRSTLEYLRVLELAAKTMEADVRLALEILREHGQVPSYEAVRDLVVAPTPPAVPELGPLAVDLKVYDQLIGSDEEAA